MKVRPIRDHADYEWNLARLEALMDSADGTPEADELEVIAALIERYEDEQYPVGAPTPIEAIRFRMEQDNLSARDLEPYIGSRARVSEVLTGARPLSIDMIRALHQHLGIPAEVLIRADPIQEQRPALQLSKPVERKLIDWGFLTANEAFDVFLTRVLGGGQAMAMLRKTRTDRTNAKTDFVAVQAWCAAALLRSESYPVKGKFEANEITLEVARTIAMLSVHDDGPLRARAMLADLGIVLVVLPHLPGTHLDGAAMRRKDGVPVIALTLRRDRIDNFWFTLIHELAHVARHLTDDREVILDDLEISSSEAIEQNADEMAMVALIPNEVMAAFRGGVFTSLSDIEDLARRAGVNPAIAAGRWQKEHRDFRKFSKLLGHGTIRRLFRDFEPTQSPV